MKFKLALKNLPFVPNRRQVIYVESEYDKTVNTFILNNYERIQRKCFFIGLEFCYLPKLAKEVCAADVAFYNAPYASVKEGNEKINSAYLLQFMAHPENKEFIPPSLLFLKYDDNDDRLKEEEVIFDGFSITDQNGFPTLEDIFFLRLEDIYNLSNENRILHRVGDEEEQYGSYNADLKFDKDALDIATDIYFLIQKLEKRGFTRYMLQQFIDGKEKLSRLKITEEFRIFLPDYGNREILMTPLPKAVFLLFLKHPEGIVFKCLPDYQEELTAIYTKLKPTADKEKVKESIIDVTNPCSNSINEKCARIREAFISQFNENLARNYFVTGARGMAKKISLPRELVEWDNK